jgi:hypothetical protein
MEKPILFSGEMVRSIKPPGIKTMTRRARGLKKINEWPNRWVFDKLVEDAKGNLCAKFYDSAGSEHANIKCPYGKPGDILWVREASAVTYSTAPKMKRTVWYKADNPEIPANVKFKWKPSIHMLRGSARIFLKITDIKVERVQDISEEDAVAEGLKCLSKDGGTTYKYGIPDSDGLPGTDNTGWPWQECDTSAKKAFQKLWHKINGEQSWTDNPWVWCVSFEVLSTTGKPTTLNNK